MFRPSLGLLVSLANSSNRLDHPFYRAAGSPKPERLLEAEMDGWLRKAKSMKTGSHGKPAKTQHRSQGSSWGASKGPQTSGSRWPRATEEGPVVQPSVYKDVCRTFRNVCLQHGRHGHQVKGQVSTLLETSSPGVQEFPRSYLKQDTRTETYWSFTLAHTKSLLFSELETGLLMISFPRLSVIGTDILRERSPPAFSSRGI